MSLRLRLFLAFAAVALIMGGLGMVAMRQSLQIKRRVTDLTSVSIARFEHDRTVGQALEVEVDRRPDGSWIAAEIEVLGGPRRPKLRGPVDAVDPAGGAIVIFGQRIAVNPDVADDLAAGAGLASLGVGDRVEVSCRIETDGTWSARKLRDENLKESNKIKGMVTAVAMDGVSPDTMAISGIPVLFEQSDRVPQPRVELKRIALATRMTHLVQDCVVAGRRLLGGADGVMVTLDGEITDAETVLLESSADLVEAVDRARNLGDEVDDDPLGLDIALWLDPLSALTSRLAAATDRFIHLTDADPAEAGTFFASVLEPLLVDDLRPLIQNYLLDTEEQLAGEVDHLAEQTDGTARALMIASAVALLCALALGRVVWLSLACPLRNLTEASDRMGRGRLDTRVAVTSRDELGHLAATLNRMAQELESTTVSIAKLDDVLESVAGALFVLDPGGVITSANRAAAALIGRPAAALKGVALADLCEAEACAALLPAGNRTTGGECRLRRDGGEPVPVSFSGAALQSGEGPAGGFVWIAQDVSGRLAMEEQLRRSLAEKELLLREVHHRVKNNLQVISSLLEMQGDCIVDEEARQIYADSQARIRSMALIHQQLYGASTLDRIDFGAYLDQLAGSLLHFHAGGSRSVVIRAEAESASLDIDRALTCGLIVNELVTNALKHAFAPRAEGTVRVGFRVDGPAFHLTVADDGAGLAGTGHDPDSLGMSLVTALVEQLGGRMEISGDGGTRIEIVFPQEEAA